MKNILSRDELRVSHTAKRLTAWRAGELTFGFGKMGIVNNLFESGFRQQWWRDKERTGSEKLIQQINFLKTFAIRQSRKMSQWLEEVVRRKDCLGRILLFEMGSIGLINNSANEDKSY